MLRKTFTWRNAPFWLPAIVFLRDFLAFQYIFSFEPGITQQAVRRGYLFMMPGSLIGGGFTTILTNLVVAVAIGLLLRFSVRDKKGKTAGS